MKTPRLVRGVFFHLHKTLRTNAKPVGASLLAMAECQPPETLTGIPLSRAGSLPQGIRCATKMKLLSWNSMPCD
ncbi:hypothetical protein C6Y56_21225 [Pseudomonas fluorescens]|uniref:Uncharacterized protein n=1 Tax=Pseudomonas fluorescens TaxID=294 RepID=A0A7Z3H0T8_PSEFL|nr:hypothetical protein C6Y56_21225 [Pseudomonas fluorescens]